MKRNFYSVISIILLIAAAAVIIVFDLCNIIFTEDEALNKLLTGIIPRIIASIALLVLIVCFGNTKCLLPDYKSLPKHLLWCIPCFLVIFANFPVTALIGGTAKIVRNDLIALFVLECLSIGLMEELLFRGFLLNTIRQLLEKHSEMYSVLITSALFGLVHIFNLFAGANIGATFLQIGYSFLIGAMLSAVVIKTNNIWLCVFIHASFDFGGNIVPELGTGEFQDLWFWIFTAVAGTICFVYILYYLLKSDKLKNGEKS